MQEGELSMMDEIEEEIAIDQDGNFIISPEAMRKILELIDKVEPEALVKKKHFCCQAISEIGDVVARRGYKEYYKEIATVKCKFWVDREYPGCGHDVDSGKCPE